MSVAFFDLDNTLLRGSSMIHLAVGFYRRGYFTNRTVAQALVREGRFRQTGVERNRDIDWAQNVALSGIAGKPVPEIELAVADIFDTRLAKRVWPGTRLLAEERIAVGDQVWVITGSPVEVAEIVAKRFGFTGGIGTEAQRLHDHYTGQLETFMHGPKKAEAAARLLHELHVSPADAAAYSDSINDLPLLKLVGHPHVVNPDPQLRAIATAHGWPIHDFVKRHRARNWVGMGAATSMALAGYLARRRNRRRVTEPATKQVDK